MTTTHWIMAGIAAGLWAASPLLFFKRDIKRWYKTRDVRRARALDDAQEKAARERRFRDELAAKYPLPPSVAQGTQEPSA
jgi:hypothetical protein